MIITTKYGYVEYKNTLLTIKISPKKLPCKQGLRKTELVYTTNEGGPAPGHTSNINVSSNSNNEEGGGLREEPNNTKTEVKEHIIN